MRTEGALAWPRARVQDAEEEGHRPGVRPGRIRAVGNDNARLAAHDKRRDVACSTLLEQRRLLAIGFGFGRALFGGGLTSRSRALGLGLSEGWGMHHAHVHLNEASAGKLA